jgi:pseudaminic acid synthase
MAHNSTRFPPLFGLMCGPWRGDDGARRRGTGRYRPWPPDSFHEPRIHRVKIDRFEIGPQQRPYVIAEMSGNHNQSLDRALAIVDAAADAGADAIKLQTYTADTMTLKVDAPGFRVDDPNSLWTGQHLYDLYQQAYTPWEWHAPIFERAKARGLHGFSTPFDETAVDFLESLDVPAYKIASFECTDLPLIRKVAATGKPMIISTGMASLAEIDETVRAARAAGCRDLVLLKCTSTYPSTPANTHLRTIPVLRDAFGCEVGLSDHTMGCGVAVAAVAFGATVVEKHFTLARADGGVDSAFSLEPAELKQLRIETERAWQALGQVQFGGSAAEQQSKEHRRSLYIVQDLAPGQTLTRDNLRAIRPGLGLPPKHLDELLGCTVRQPVPRGTPASWALVR